MFSPPFVMASTDNNFYGYDIATIEFICEYLDRECVFTPMNDDDLLKAVQNQQANVAIGGIIMTLGLARNNRFSLPYLASNAQFITKLNSPIKEPFKLDEISEQTIGVVDRTALERNIRALNLKTEPKIIEYDNTNQMIEALKQDMIDLALMSEPQVAYWTSNASKMFRPLGDPFPIGFGFVMAVDVKTDPEFINLINIALTRYCESNRFKQNYYIYLHHPK